jgi:hypothetical protein
MKIDHVAQCRFFSAEDACRIALQAYFAAGKYIEPPAGEPWLIEGQPYACAADFADAFNGELQARLALLTLEKLGDFNAASSSWDLYKIAADIEPEKMAPIISAREMENAKLDAEFFGHAMNELPPEDNHVNKGEASGNANAG